MTIHSKITPEQSRDLLKIAEQIEFERAKKNELLVRFRHLYPLSILTYRQLEYHIKNQNKLNHAQVYNLLI